MSNNNFKIFSIFICFAFGACKSDYTKFVEKELAKEQTNDSLIFGMKMGQTQKDYFDICWKLNRDKIIGQGPGGNTAKYLEVLDSTQDQTLVKELLFTPLYDDKKVIRGMDLVYNYEAWSLWKKDSQSDSLLVQLKKKFLKEYPGNDFMEIDIKDKAKAFAKIDGNRQILIFAKSNKDVAVKIEDLKYKYKK